MNDLPENCITNCKDCSFNKYFNIALMACHINSNLKYKAVINNIKKILHNVDMIIIINSCDTQKLDINFDNNGVPIIYYEINNDKFFDFGKWYKALQIFRTIVDKYQNIIFLNDSFFITTNIDDFFQKLPEYDFFGMTNNMEIKHHYQSYLFSIKQPMLHVFENLFIKYENNINNMFDVIVNYEVNLSEQFTNKNCLVKTAQIFNRNIFFYNPILYTKLLFSNELPIVKIKILPPDNVEFDLRNFNYALYRNLTGLPFDNKNLLEHYKNGLVYYKFLQNHKII